MYRPQNLRIPGPTFVPQAVLAASARPLINHRGPEFAALLAALTRALQDFLRTEHDVLLLTASGSGGMEAAIANTLSSGDKVLAFSCGAFGERFAAICKALTNCRKSRFRGRKRPRCVFTIPKYRRFGRHSPKITFAAIPSTASCGEANGRGL